MGFAFAVDIMSNAPTSDVAVKFADYVSENYIDVDYKFSPTLWAQPSDVSEAIPHMHQQWHTGLS